MRSHAILAVFKRNVASYFSGLLGYLFIVVFVVAGSLLAFKAEFFAANQANLDQLSAWYPLLLVFIIPAITMTAWSDERKLGTDELLFTLPATDVEILLGKYLAVLAVYTTALIFSLTHAMVLARPGDPDLWALAATYCGYRLAGAALIGARLFASVLTSSGGLRARHCSVRLPSASNSSPTSPTGSAHSPSASSCATSRSASCPSAACCTSSRSPRSCCTSTSS